MDNNFSFTLFDKLCRPRCCCWFRFFLSRTLPFLSHFSWIYAFATVLALQLMLSETVPTSGPTGFRMWTNLLVEISVTLLSSSLSPILTPLPYIQKTGLACWKIPQKIQIFRRKIVLERENYQFCNVLRKGQRAYSKTKVSWKVLQNRFLVSDLEFHLRMGGNTHCVTQ